MMAKSWTRLWAATENYRIALANLNGYRIAVNLGSGEEAEEKRWTEEKKKAEHELYLAAGEFRRNYEADKDRQMINEAFERHQREMGRQT